MMKLTLDFNMPEDIVEFEYHMYHCKYSAVFEEFDNYLRNRLKYEELDAETQKVLSDCRTKLREIEKDHGLPLE
jgi:hypothetical protein